MIDCQRCKLCKSRMHIVWGQGPQSPVGMLIGEAPGEMEDAHGQPFYVYAKAGAELTNYLEKETRISRDYWYITNVVKCRPPGNRTPRQDEISACKHHLQEELQTVRPNIIGCLGLTATQALLGSDADLETLHGIPVNWSGALELWSGAVEKWSGVIVPMYHPAAGLHESRYMVYLLDDFKALGEVVRGERRPEQWVDKYPESEYREVSSAQDMPLFWKNNNDDKQHVVGVDTEDQADGRIWSVQWSTESGTGYMVSVSNKECLSTLGHYLKSPLVHTVVHNIMHDLPRLQALGIEPYRIYCTMHMAYHLQDLPQGLKPLAFRLAGMKMKDYNEMVSEATRVRALEYLENVVEYPWPDPEPVLEWTKGRPKVRKPQNIGRKVRRILADVVEKNADPWARWHVTEGREVVERVFGRMQPGDLSDVTPRQRAIDYSARDADAVLRIFPILWQRIQEIGLERVFWMDMAIIPMCLDMQRFGMRIVKERFAELSSVFQQRMDELQVEIAHYYGGDINPGSLPQVRELLFKKLKLRSRKKTPTTEEEATGNKILAGMKDQHPSIQKVLDWRAYEKLKGTYADTVPLLVDENERVHTTIRTTRVETGRLASANPNLTNQPVRSDEGRMIRDCYEAEDGCDLLSVDLSQIELRVLSHDSQDPTMIDVFRRGQDIHAKTGSEIFGIPMNQLDDYRHRRPAKTCNFGIVYGISAQGLRDQIISDGGDPWEWTLDRCREFINEWFDVYPGVRIYMNEKEAEARRYGYVTDIFGRIRRVPGVKSVHRWVRSRAIREGNNMPIQSGAQGVIKTAMAEATPIYKQFLVERRRVRPLIQIHDDLLWEVETGLVETCYVLFRNVMESCVELRVPVLAEGKRGKSWGSMKKIKEGKDG